MNFIKSLFGEVGGGVLAGVLALAIVIILIIFLVWALKILLNATERVSKSNQRRLGVSETFALDQKRQLLLVRRDNVEHLILLGGNSEIIIENNIPIERKTSLNNKATNIKNQKDMQKLGSKIKSTLARAAPKLTKDTATLATAGAALGEVSLRHTGLLRRSDDNNNKDAPPINPQDSDVKEQIHEHRAADSDIDVSNKDIFFIDEIDEIDQANIKNGKSGVAKTNKRNK